jgi:hypothetical protein
MTAGMSSSDVIRTPLRSWTARPSVCHRTAQGKRLGRRTGNTLDWNGHDADALVVSPTADEIRNGGYAVVSIDRSVDTAASLAADILAVRGHAANSMALCLRRLQMASKRGRPPKQAERRTVLVAVRFSASEHVALGAHAEVLGVSLSTWCRMRALDALRIAARINTWPHE